MARIYKNFTHFCHFDEGEILARSSTKIGYTLWSYLRGFLLRRNDKIVSKALRLCEIKSFVTFKNLNLAKVNESKMKHLFKAQAKWTSKQNEENPSKRYYTKTHEIKIEGKPILTISAAKTFKGDPELYNPEDLLLSSLVSCHMMSYLYACSQNGIEVLEYSDNAEATLEVNTDGSGRFTEVRLNPKVTISNHDQIELAVQLHTKANQLCFIANSCNFPVLHNASCEVF